MALDLAPSGTGTGHTIAPETTASTVTFDPPAVTFSRSQISFATDPGFATGDAVVYHKGATGNTAPGGLIDGTTYYVIRLSSSAIRLAATMSDAMLGNAVFISSTGTGTGETLVPSDPTKTATFASTAVTIDSSQVAFANPHGLATGEEVVYHNVGGADSAIGGLVDGHSYYVIRLDALTIELAATPLDAQAGRFLFFTTRGNGNRGKPEPDACEYGRRLCPFTPATAISATGGAAATVTAQTGAVMLSAADGSMITANGGGVGLAVGGGGGNGAGVAIGISAARNLVQNSVEAYADGYTVTAKTGASLSATENATIQALTIGGAVGGGGGGGAGVGIGAAGAGSGNTIRDTVEAFIRNASVVTTATGNVNLTAMDTATITANGGGVGVAIGGGGGGRRRGVARCRVRHQRHRRLGRGLYR